MCTHEYFSYTKESSEILEFSFHCFHIQSSFISNVWLLFMVFYCETCDLLQQPAGLVRDVSVLVNQIKIKDSQKSSFLFLYCFGSYKSGKSSYVKHTHPPSQPHTTSHQNLTMKQTCEKNIKKHKEYCALKK